MKLKNLKKYFQKNEYQILHQNLLNNQVNSIQNTKNYIHRCLNENCDFFYYSKEKIIDFYCP
jgi:hypothetical protein